MKYLKKLFGILTFLSIYSISFAQTSDNNLSDDYKNFISTFSQRIYYPTDLMRLGTPIVCLIKVQTDDSKKIIDMQLSDSADTLMQVEFKKLKSGLNTKTLEHYLQNAYPVNNCNIYIIPLSYSMRQMYPTLQTIKITTLYNYAKFKGFSINGNVIFLEPIYLDFGVQH